LVLLQTLIDQSRQPTGRLGRLMLRIMNSSHRSLVSLGLSKLHPCKSILDVSCGGGNAVFQMAQSGKFEHIYGIDFSQDAVALTTAWNKKYKFKEACCN